MPRCQAQLQLTSATPIESQMLTRRIANLLGVCSALALALFWVLLLTAPRWYMKPWHMKLPGEVATKMTVLAAVAASSFASLKGSRWWLLALVAALVTLGVVLQAPV